VTMSLGIFTEKARRNPLFWRPLGYVSNENIDFSSAQNKALSADIKNQRFHNILRGIFDTFIRAQSPDEMNEITLQLGPHTKKVNLYLPLAYIIGDIEGGNQLTGYRGYARVTCPRISMTCDCPTDQAFNSERVCNFIKQADVQSMISNGEISELHQMGQRSTDLVFFHIDCGNDPYGIFSMVMTEPLHALEAGLFPYIMEVLFFQMQGDKTRGPRLDQLIQSMSKLPRQHGTEDFPRLKWPDGVTSLTNLTGDQKVGKFFAIAMLSDTQQGQDFFTEALGSAQAWQDMNEIFQMFLCYWVWLKRDTYWRINDSDSEDLALQAIHVMIGKLVKLWPRGNGNGWHLPKVHAQFHVPRNIARMGNQMNVHSGPQEANHKVLQKQPSKNAQRRAGVIDIQIAKRLSEFLVIKKAQSLMNPPSITPLEPQSATNYATKGYLVLTKKHGETFITANTVWPKKKKYGKLELPQFEDIVQHVIRTYWTSANTLANGDLELKLKLFSEYKREGIVYRSHSNYRGGGAWIDWCLINWEEEVEGPAKILTFFEDPSQSLCALVYPCDTSKVKPHSILSDLIPMEQDPRSNRPLLQIVSVDSLQHHVLMLPYAACATPQHNSEGNWMVQVHERDSWSDKFQNFD
jgi:hypothetical protein